MSLFTGKCKNAVPLATWQMLDFTLLNNAEILSKGAVGLREEQGKPPACHWFKHFS